MTLKEILYQLQIETLQEVRKVTFYDNYEPTYEEATDKAEKAIIKLMTLEAIDKMMGGKSEKPKRRSTTHTA